jgi:cyclopropane-fatty-acyl-phospholipid synthase
VTVSQIEHFSGETQRHVFGCLCVFLRAELRVGLVPVRHAGPRARRHARKSSCVTPLGRSQLCPPPTQLVEANLVPDVLLRLAIRAIVAHTLATEDKGSEGANLAHKMEYIRKLREGPIAIEQTLANRQHYEVPTELFDLFLGSRKKYSACLFTDATTSLDESEDISLSMVCERARLHLLPKARSDESRPRVLDLGCGWGSFTLFAAERFPHVDFTAVSNSRTQREYIMGVAKRKELTNVRVITADATVFAPPAGESYDRVVSVEMLEHMKNYEVLFARIKSWLRPGGLFFAHIFTHKKYAYHFEGSSWMSQTFFSGGQMPSDDLFCYFQRDLCLREHWVINGKHYQRTLDAWLAKLDANKARALEVLSKAENPLLEFVNWRLFLLGCSENFGYNDGEEWMVSHYLFERPEDVKVKALPASVSSPAAATLG